MTPADAAARGNREWMGVVLASVLFSLAFLAVLPSRWNRSQSVDYPIYYAPVARNLLDGKGFLTAEGRPAVAYPPGYPLLLAGVFTVARVTGFSELGVLRGFNVIMLATASALLYSVARLLFGIRTARLAALAWMSYPLPLWLTKQPNTELAFLMAFFGTVCIVFRILFREGFRLRLAWSAGALVGVASLMRPAALALSVPVAVALFCNGRGWPKKQRWRTCAFLFLGNLLVIAPWELWASRQVGEVIPLCTNGATAIRDGLSLDLKSGDLDRVVKVPEEVRALIQRFTQRESEMKSPRLIARFLGDAFVDRPASVTKLAALKAIRSWYATDSQQFEPYVAIIQAPYLLLAGVGGFAAWRRGGIFRDYVAFAALVLLYFWGMTILVLSIARYMIPAMGLLMVLTGFALSTILDRFRPPRRSLAPQLLRMTQGSAGSRRSPLS